MTVTQEEFKKLRYEVNKIKRYNHMLYKWIKDLYAEIDKLKQEATKE